MNRYHLISLICFFIGIIFFTLGILSGDVKAGFIIVIPFLAGSGVYAFLGFIFVFIAIILFMFSFSCNVELNNFDNDKYQATKKTSIKGGGVVLIGPIPIVFGSNWKIALLLMIIAFLIMITLIFLL